VKKISVVIGSDHRGFELKRFLISTIHHVNWYDVGADSKERSDYPVYAKRAEEKFFDCGAEAGLLICGTGIGMSIAANRFKGIRAALCWNIEIAELSRKDDLANFLVMPGDLLNHNEAQEIFERWISAKPGSGRYALRAAMLDKL